MATPVVHIETLTFDQQVEAITERGIAADEPELRGLLETSRPAEPAERSALVLSREVVPVASAAARVERHGKPVVLGHIEPDDLETYVPIEAVELPDAPAYLAIDIDLGAGSRNVPPENALRDILEAGRSPLTIDEGIALVLQQPEVIASNCWDRNPHTWLGTASCARRAAASR